VRQREIDMKFAERRLMIEKGLPIPADCKPPDTPEERTRRGIMKVCVAVGIAVAYLLLNFVPTSLVADVADAQAWALGLGPLIGAWGLGQILSARFAPRADETREKTPGGSTT
jgi:hypothetical protein